MKIIRQSHEITYMGDPTEILKRIERAGRTCYKSEDKITDESAEAFVAKLVRTGHLSVLEHESIQVRFITDRGVTHELVRHRLAAYSQESTRYCDYGEEEVRFVLPVEFSERYVGTWPYGTSLAVLGGTIPERAWFLACIQAGSFYRAMRDAGAPPQLARSVLPNCLKTEIVMTANLREWLHVLELRTSKAAHPQIRALMLGVLRDFAEKLPAIFGVLGSRLMVVE